MTPSKTANTARTRDSSARLGAQLVDAQEPEAQAPPAAPSTGVKHKQRNLRGGMPRRYRDHRSRAGKRYRENYLAVIGAFPPKDQFGRFLAGMMADLMVDYETTRRTKRKNARGYRRKLVGNLFGMLRELRYVTGSAKHRYEDNLNAALQEFHEQDKDDE